MLPGFVKKLISGYELRCFHFEIFESFRFLALVGAPIAFPPGRASPIPYYYFILLLHSSITTKSYSLLLVRHSKPLFLGLTTHYSLLTTHYSLLTTYCCYYLGLALPKTRIGGYCSLARHNPHYSLLTTHHCR